jgi:hypothetical protein
VGQCKVPLWPYPRWTQCRAHPGPVTWVQSGSSHSGSCLAPTAQETKGVEDVEAEWSRVERRKSRNARKREAKHQYAIHVRGQRDPLLTPGILPDFLSLPPLPASATANPRIPNAIPLPTESNTPLPFINSTFSHAFPTRAPGDQSRMYSVLGTFFQGPVSSEKKRRIEARLACMSFFSPTECPLRPPLLAERAFDKDPSLYLLSLHHMIENDYPIPTWQTSSTSQTVGWRLLSLYPNPSYSFHTKANARGYTPLTTRWCAITSPLRGLLHPTQCLTEDGK